MAFSQLELGSRGIIPRTQICHILKNNLTPIIGNGMANRLGTVNLFGGPMRFIKTFILRLYLDPHAPERLCGDLHPLEEQANYPFKNLTELETLLSQLAKKPFVPEAAPPDAALSPTERHHPKKKDDPK